MTTTKGPLPDAPYVHREPGPLRRAVPWLIAAVTVALLIVLGVILAGTLRGRAPSFTIVVIKNGWVGALGVVLGIAAVMALTSLIGQRVGQARTGRRISYAAVLGDQLTHLFLWIVVLIAVYPLFYVLVASFDPTNSLFQFPNFDAKNIFVRTGIWPDFSKSNFDNYLKLFDGVTLPWYQGVLMVAAAVSLVMMLVLGILNRARQGLSAQAALVQTWATRVLVVTVALLALAITPAQFTGQSNESRFILSVRNSVLVSGLTGLLAILLSTTAGYAMARLRFPGRFQMLLFFIFIQMFPVFLGLVAIYFMLTALGLANSFLGLVLAYSGGAIAFNTWIFKGFVESLPESLEEAAMVDGATRWQTFWRVVLPLSGSMLVFIFLNQFIGTYAEFILSSVIMTGVEHWTVGIMLQSFTQGQFSTKWGVFAAASVLGALPIIALFYGFQQYFVGGATAGGVKE